MSRGYGRTQRTILAVLSDGRRWRVAEIVRHVHPDGATPAEYEALRRAAMALWSSGALDRWLAARQGGGPWYSKCWESGETRPSQRFAPP